MAVRGVNFKDGVSRTFVEYRAVMREPKRKKHGPSAVSFKAPLTKHNRKRGEKPSIELNIALLAASMQAVSGTNMGIACSQEGLMSVTYQSQPIESQAKMVYDIKRAKAGFQMDVVSIKPDATLGEAKELIEKRGYSNIAVTENGESNGKLIGFISERTIRELDNGRIVRDVMKPFVSESLESIVTGVMVKGGKAADVISAIRRYMPYGKSGLTLRKANELLLMHQCRFLPIVGREGNLAAVVFDKDLRTHQEHPLEMIDSHKRLMAAAGINTHDYKERVPALVEAGVDVLFVDSSNGFTEWQRDCIKWVGKHHAKIPVVGGNVITKEAFRYLVRAGACAIKIGMGGGSICITQEEKGVGRGQASALYEIAVERDKYYKETGIYVPLICDGGIVNPKDIAMAYAFGADIVMMGRWFARLRESPSEVETRGGQPVKPYWGEGTERARNWQRYIEGDDPSLPFEEGIEGWVPYVGTLAENLPDALNRVRAFFADNARLSIIEMHEKPIHVERISLPSIREGRAHDILIDPSRQDISTDRLGQYRAKEWGLDRIV